MMRSRRRSRRRIRMRRSTSNKKRSWIGRGEEQDKRLVEEQEKK